MVHQFVFQATPEALHGRVIVAVPAARPGWLHAELLHQFLIIMDAVQQVVGHRQVMIRVRGGLELALLLAAQGQFATQAHDAVTPRRKALRGQFRLHAQRPIRLPAVRVHGLDGDLQACVNLRPPRRFAVRPGVKTAARDAKDAAQDGDGLVELQGLHDRVLGSDSRAKYAAAFFTISRSMRASASSLRSLLTSASSSGTERLPRATLEWSGATRHLPASALVSGPVLPLLPEAPVYRFLSVS